MGKRKATDDPNPSEPTGGRKVRKPDIMWGAKDHELVLWNLELLTEVGKPENHKVLFGEKILRICGGSEKVP
jgi:hypothetical protein